MRHFKCIALSAGLALGLAWGCGESLSELLLDALCVDDGDCAASQNCFKTIYQEAAGGQGWCRDNDSCALGAQPGCACLQSGTQYSCTPTTEPGLLPSSQDPNCACVFTCDASQPETPCPGALNPSTPTDLGNGCVCN